MGEGEAGLCIPQEMQILDVLGSILSPFSGVAVRGPRTLATCLEEEASLLLKAILCSSGSLHAVSIRSYFADICCTPTLCQALGCEQPGRHCPCPHEPINPGGDQQ